METRIPASLQYASRSPRAFTRPALLCWYSTAVNHQIVLPKYSIGVGDRFAHQARAQLRSCLMARELGKTVVPVWNKSNREHMIVGSEPFETRAAADAAVAALGWKEPYFLDADHINLGNVGRFLAPCDFFTIDVAEAIGKPVPSETVEAFLRAHPELPGAYDLPGAGGPFEITPATARSAAEKYLGAALEAGAIYRTIESAKGAGNFITEVSMDETDAPQTPDELLVILAALASENIPLQTIAPKFTGRFNKGVDYVGDASQFEREFKDDVAVIACAVSRYGLPANLKLSVHSGSDKFSIYPGIARTLASTGAGVHLKTAGTTWLEELIGLAEAGGAGLALAKQVYAEAYAHAGDLCAPYASVIDIDSARLPAPGQVSQWTSEQYVHALRHNPVDPLYNPHLRQLLHVGYKVAAQLGETYLSALRECEDSVARNVTANLFERHLRPVFLI